MTEPSTDQLNAAAGRRRHGSCGLVGPGWRGCRRCLMVDAYLARREMYRDAVELQGRGDGRYEPVRPVVTFGWWLGVYYANSGPGRW